MHAQRGTGGVMSAHLFGGGVDGVLDLVKRGAEHYVGNPATGVGSRRPGLGGGLASWRESMLGTVELAGMAGCCHECWERREGLTVAGCPR